MNPHVVYFLSLSINDEHQASAVIEKGLSKTSSSKVSNGANVVAAMVGEREQGLSTELIKWQLDESATQNATVLLYL